MGLSVRWFWRLAPGIWCVFLGLWYEFLHVSRVFVVSAFSLLFGCLRGGPLSGGGWHFSGWRFRGDHYQIGTWGSEFLTQRRGFVLDSVLGDM